MTAADRAQITATVNAAVQAATANIDAYVKEALRLLDTFHNGALASPDDLPLVLALHIDRIRDMALQAINPANAANRSDTWTNLAMRTEPVFIAPVATLAACAAFLAGDAKHGTGALETALICDPGYRLAHLMQGMLRTGSLHADFDVSDLPLPDVQPRRTWAIPLLRRADLHRQLTATGPAAIAGHDLGTARAAVARAAHAGGLAVTFTTTDSAHYERDGKALTITYGHDGGLAHAFWIHTRSQPGRRLDSLPDVLAALTALASGPDDMPPA
ncbi:hypothetical protein GCM10022224_104100 [Nonomuraea antimicrobica]|uniref:Uncharacterized protein n=2 Tax=Nonomuraea antimicrobica TaxID=561173 RepID=A0ABP7EP17_9ACTN